MERKERHVSVEDHTKLLYTTTSSDPNPIGCRHTVSPETTAAARKQANPRSSGTTISTAIAACASNRVLGINPPANTVWGTAETEQGRIFWSCSCNVTKVTYVMEGDEQPSLLDSRKLFLYPGIIWYIYFGNDGEVAGFKDKTAPTTADYILFSDALYYGQPNKEQTVVFSCTEEDCVGSKPARKTQNGFLPWGQDKLSAVPDDCSVSSAKQGKYHLPYIARRESEGMASYDFAGDIVCPEMLDAYVDNPCYRSVVARLRQYISCIARKFGLDESSADISQYMREKGVKMTGINGQNIYVSGEPGTGKTSVFAAVAATFGLPLCVVRLGEADERDVITKTVMTSEESRSGFEALMSRVYWYVKYGGLLLFDDVACANANMLFSTIGGLLETSYAYRVGGETVRRHPLCIIGCTSNVGTESARKQDEAFMSRFSHIFMGKPDTASLEAVLIKKARADTGFVPEAYIEKPLAHWIVSVYEATYVAATAVDEDYAMLNITPRLAYDIASQLYSAIAEDEVVDAVGTAKAVICGYIMATGSKELAKQIEVSVDGMPMLVLPNN